MSMSPNDKIAYDNMRFAYNVTTLLEDAANLRTILDYEAAKKDAELKALFAQRGQAQISATTSAQKALSSLKEIEEGLAAYPKSASAIKKLKDRCVLIESGRSIPNRDELIRHLDILIRALPKYLPTIGRSPLGDGRDMAFMRPPSQSAVPSTSFTPGNGLTPEALKLGITSISSHADPHTGMPVIQIN